MWQDLIDRITNHTVNSGEIDHFRKIKGNAAKVEFALQSDAFRSQIIPWAKSCINTDRTSSVLKEQGNQYFGACQYPESIASYTTCIKVAEKDSPEYAIALANRSAALFHLQRYEECLRDIESALTANYPESFIPKLLVRKYRTLTKINTDVEAAAQFLDELKTSLPKSFQNDLKKAELEAKSLKTHHTAPQEHEKKLPELLKGANKSVRGISAALDVKYAPKKGRYVIAQAPVSLGDTLFMEKPYALVLLPDYRFTHCHHCVKKLSNYIPCLACGEAWFCSLDCQDSSQDYHRYECGLHRLLTAIGIAHLGLRVVLTAGLDKIRNFDQQRSTLAPPEKNNIYEQLEDNYSAVFHLVTHMDDAEPSELYLYTLTAALVTHLLRDYTNFIDPGVDASFVGGYLLHHIRQLVCNAHAVTAVESEGTPTSGAVSSVSQERIATAIYPSASLMNHSCDPSIISGFVGSMLIVKAVKDLAVNEEVFNCYGPHFRRMPRPERQEALRNQYCFTCECSACTDPEDFHEKLMSFRCLSCGGSLTNPQTGGIKSNKVQTAKCRDCRTEQPYVTQLRADLEAIALFKKGEENLDLGDMKSALKCFSTCYALRKEALNAFHPDLAQTLDLLAHSYALLEDYPKSAHYLRLALPAVEYRYGKFSIEVAHEYQKFTDVLIQQLALQKSVKLTQEVRQYLERALEIFEMHYGTWHEDYQDLQSKLRSLT